MDIYKKKEYKKRSTRQTILDFITFPIRAVTLFEYGACSLSSLREERFDYVAREVLGYCLDAGCGKDNLFIKEYLHNDGVGIDVFEYKGLTQDQIIKDMTKLPYSDNTFMSVTLIANINHIPSSIRDKEIRELYRCTKTNGNIIVTMGNPIAELIVHKVVFLYDKILGTNIDMDTERGMHEEESYYLTDTEIRNYLQNAGYVNIKKKYFITQWGLNHLFVGDKI